MKKNLLLALGICLFVFSCEDYDSSHGKAPAGVYKTPTTGTTPVVSGYTQAQIDSIMNALANGSGTNTGTGTNPGTNPGTALSSSQWWPMAVGNTWTMSAMGQLDTMTIKGTEIVGGYTYFITNTDEEGYTRFRYAANGDLYTQEVDLANNAEPEYVVIPANPTVNQSWFDSGKTSEFKVESLNATIGNYTGLLSIAVYDPADGTKAAVLYYKRGLGFVGSTLSIMGASIEMVLSSYVLK